MPKENLSRFINNPNQLLWTVLILCSVEISATVPVKRSLSDGEAALTCSYITEYYGNKVSNRNVNLDEEIDGNECHYLD